MGKRPAAVVVPAICCFLAPLAALVRIAVSSGRPVLGPGNFFPGVAILVLYPACGVALLSARRWGWHLFLGCSTALIAYHAGSYVFHPGWGPLASVLANVGLFAAAGTLSRALVFRPRSSTGTQWWETEPHYRVEASLQLVVGEAVVSGEILDISRSGCFVSLVLELQVGETYRMHLKCHRYTLDVDGKVMRKAGRGATQVGYGIKFVKNTREQAVTIDRIVGELERGGLRDYIRDQEMIPSGIVNKGLYGGVTETEPRYTVLAQAIVADKNDSRLCRIVDISKYGCLIQTDGEFQEGASYTVMIHLMKMRFTGVGRVERRIVFEGKRGYSIRFVDLPAQKQRELRNLLAVLKRLGMQSSGDVPA